MDQTWSLLWWGALVVEWSKALVLRETINENQMIPGVLTGLSNISKKNLSIKCKKSELINGLVSTLIRSTPRENSVKRV